MIDDICQNIVYPSKFLNFRGEKVIFVILTAQVNDGIFNVKYNVAKATNFLDFSWAKIGRVMVKNK